MSDFFSKLDQESIGQKILRSLRSFIFGIGFFLASFLILWKNEGCAVSQQAALDELRPRVLKADAQNPSPAHEAKPVLVVAPLYSRNFTFDDQFILKQPVLKLTRKVEMFQWDETRDQSKSNKNAVKYEKIWSTLPISSNLFRDSATYRNPSFEIQSDTLMAKEVTFGKYNGESVLKRVNPIEPVKITLGSLSPQIEAVKMKLNKSNVQVIDDTIYLTRSSPQAPEIGDYRVKYLAVKTDYYTAIANQANLTDLIPYISKNGNELFLVEKGNRNVSYMIKSKENLNSKITWIIRGIGFVFMWIGLLLTLAPFVSFFTSIPFLGELVERGVAIFAGLVSLALSGITIIVAKIFYNPVYLVTVLIAIGVYLYFQSKKERESMVTTSGSGVRAGPATYPSPNLKKPIPGQAMVRSNPVKLNLPNPSSVRSTIRKMG